DEAAHKATAAAPDHQGSPFRPTSGERASPVSSRLATPIVALTAGASTAANSAKRRTSWGRSNTARPPAHRRMRYVATTASNVLPTAIPTEETTSPDVVRFTANAPMRTPGHNVVPNRRSAAMARPVGGHTAV